MDGARKYLLERPNIKSCFLVLNYIEDYRPINYLSFFGVNKVTIAPKLRASNKRKLMWRNFICLIFISINANIDILMVFSTHLNLHSFLRKS